MQDIISTFENCIASVQLKLSDYISKVPKIKDGIASRLSENRSKNVNNPVELLFHIGNRFEIQFPHCPECGSSKVIKQEYYPRNLKLAEFGHQTVYVRRYYCKACEKKFNTPLDVIVIKGHQYAKIYQNHIRESYKTGYNSFRHLQKIIRSFFNDSPSHQTIYNWIHEMNPKQVALEQQLSGYYCYDEQYLKLDSKRFYRINLIDSVLNKPVRESIVNDLEYDTVKLFIEKAISCIPVHAITTDHRREYKNIMDELKINHQLCIFHLYKMIGKEITPKLNSKFISNSNKIRLCILFSEIKEIFRTFNMDIAIYRLNELLKKTNEIPRAFNKFIQKIEDDFERLTLFMRDGFVSRTTNPIENYYRTTMPDSLKRIFKTPEGALKYLDIRRDYWVEHISKNI